MVRKARRASLDVLKTREKEAKEEARDFIVEARKYAESWRAISSTEFAKLFIQKCNEIKESAYIRMRDISLSDLDTVDGENLKSIMRAMQQRIIVVDELLSTFIPMGEE